MGLSPRTDMASEAHRLWQRQAGETGELPGVLAREERLEGFPVSAVEILDERGAEALGKAPGHYYILELPRFFGRGEPDFPAACAALARLLRRCLPEGGGSVLIAALGNPEITPDALGPAAADRVLVTRHLKQRPSELFETLREVSVSRPGVLGSSGVESSQQLRALCKLLEPAAVIAVDALAGAEPERLCRTVQVCDTGVAPGSGVGNDRAALNRESLGCPVIALGVPTVIDAGLFSAEECVAGLFVTPRDIDRVIRRAGFLLGSALNLALQPELNLEDLEALLD